MNWNKITGILVCILMGFSFSYGQTSLSEPKYREFHEYFFTGLKEKGIGNYKKALHSFEKAHQIDGQDLGTLFELSKVQALLLDFNDATHFALLFLDNEPENQFVLAHLATVYTKQYRYDDAIKTRKKILKIAPKQVDELILLYLKNKEKEKALKLIKKAEDNAYATLRTISLKKYVLKRLAPKKKMMDKVNVRAKNRKDLKASVRQEGSYKSYLNLVKYEERLQLYKQLLEDASEGLELYPSQSQLYLSKGIALNKLEKFNLAIETLLIGVDFVIENPQLEAKFYHQLAVSYGELNQSSQAKKFVEKRLKLLKKE
ncbi:MAG: hypothetical protein JKY08_03655 [Flavobacteriaceae bacterium]|nr:hypothetical protein [Flavobacteriaceae bacterium]